MGSTSRERAGRVVRKAGGLVWRRHRDGPRLAIVHRPKHDDWSLPKGKLESGESFREAAVREVREEIGFRVRLHHFAGRAVASSGRTAKVIHFWHMSTEGGRFAPSDEVDQVLWVAPDDALERLDSARDRDLVRRAIERRAAKAIL